MESFQNQNLQQFVLCAQLQPRNLSFYIPKLDVDILQIHLNYLVINDLVFHKLRQHSFLQTHSHPSGCFMVANANGSFPMPT